MTSSAVSTVVILNPNAGGDRAPPAVAELLAHLGPVRVEETSGPGRARAIAAEAGEAGAERVVAVGGDGTLHEVVNGMWPYRDRCVLGVVPEGTGNDTARSLELPLKPEEAVALIAAGEPMPVDLITLRIDDGETEVAINAITGGFGGEVADRATGELKERWGPLAYARSAADALAEIPSFRLRIEVDGELAAEIDAYSVVVANGPFAARGVPVAPGALPDDGLLSVHVVEEIPVRELIAMVPALLRGKIPGSDRYRTWSCRTVSITSDRDMEVSVDGELRTGRRFSYEIVPAALGVYRG